MTRTRSLVEAALLTGLSVILFIGGDIPVAGVLLTLLAPVPLVILEMRNDLRIGFVSLMVGSLLTAMLQGPISAAYYAFGFAVLGLALGFIIDKRQSAVEILAWGSLVSLLCKLTLTVILFKTTGLNPMNLDLAGAEQMMDMVLKLPGGAGKADEMKAMLENVMKMLPMVIPAMFIMISVIDCYISYWISGKAIKRLSGVELPKFPPFNTWRFPSSVLLAFLAALACLILGARDPARFAFLTRIGLNLQLLVNYLFIIEGMALAAWWMDSKKMPRFGRNAVLVMLFIFPMLSVITMYAGMIDMCWNMRVRFGGGKR